MARCTFTIEWEDPEPAVGAFTEGTSPRATAEGISFNLFHGVRQAMGDVGPDRAIVRYNIVGRPEGKGIFRACKLCGTLIHLLKPEASLAHPDICEGCL
jgi:hypothetical protein